jgi:general secretion pathway protein D
VKKKSVAIVALAAAGSLSLSASTASRLYKQGRKAERDGAIAQAYILYSEAFAADPRNSKYRERAEALKVQAAIESKLKPPAVGTPPAEAGELEPTLEDTFLSITDRELAEAQQTLPPAELALPPAPASYDLKGDFKSLWEQLAARLGLQTVFDGEYQPGNQTRLRLDDVTSREALHDLEAATNSFLVPLSSKLIMVAKDNENKRRDLEQVEVVTVPVPHSLTPQDITELGQVVKQTIGVDKVFWDASAGAIVIRDRVSRARVAQAILNQLIAYRPEVAIDLEFLEVSESDLIDLGADLQTSFPIVYLGKFLNGTGSVPTGIQGLLTFGGGKTLFGIGAMDMNITAVMNSSKARSLLKTSVVSVEGQKATFHSGDKYPIMTSGYFGNVQTSAQTFTPTPSFTFEDLGIVVNVTPKVHEMGEVSLDLDTEYKVLGAGQVNGIPIISSRKLQSTIRLKNNQWAMVAGLMAQSESRSLTGPPLLSRIPILKDFISHFTRQKARNYVLLAIKPRLLSLPPDQRVTRAIYLGTETKPLTPL